MAATTQKFGERKKKMEAPQVQARPDQKGAPAPLHVRAAAESVAAHSRGQSPIAGSIVGKRAGGAMIAECIERAAGMKIDIGISPRDLEARQPSPRCLARSVGRRWKRRDPRRFRHREN